MAQNELGNTKPTRVRHRAYCITLNNYTEEEYQNLFDWAQRHCIKSIIGKEGKNTQTPHLQGYLKFKNPIDFNTIKNINNRLHIEKARGNDKDNFKYCSKENDYIEINMLDKQNQIKNKILKKYENVTWKPWQKEVLELINEEPDDRKIIWIYDDQGNNGKTFLRKYIALTRKTLICDGKKTDVLNALKVKCIDNDEDIEIVLMDIPRHQQEYINYGLLEQLKDGHIYSGKYEGGEIWLDNIHVIVFSNSYPELNKFSNDRWHIIDLSERNTACSATADC